MALTNKERRDRDIYNYVTSKLEEKVGTEQKYRYGAVLAMAEARFYLSSDTIADIVRTYEPPAADPNQLSAFELPAPQRKK
jgi:hypothetical protein